MLQLPGLPELVTLGNLAFFTSSPRENGPRILRSWWLWTRPSLCNDRCLWFHSLSVHSSSLAAEVVALLVVDFCGMFPAGFAGLHFAL